MKVENKHHTQLPWSLGDSGLTVLKFWPDPDPNCAPRVERIADVYEGLQFSAETRANAGLIVESVNERPQLLAERDALREALNGLLEVTSCRVLSFNGGKGAVKAPAISEAVGRHFPAMECDCCVCEAARVALKALALSQPEMGKE